MLLLLGYMGGFLVCRMHLLFEIGSDQLFFFLFSIGAVMRTMLGEPTGTSSKFVNMMVQALEEFQEEHSVVFEKITKIPLEGEGTIDGRVLK